MAAAADISDLKELESALRGRIYLRSSDGRHQSPVRSWQPVPLPPEHRAGLTCPFAASHAGRDYINPTF